jgi:Domain of unknown function (DUF6766)
MGAHVLLTALLIQKGSPESKHPDGDEVDQRQLEHGAGPVSLWSFVTSSEFWFQSMQNWQSEFLAVAALAVLSIFLRQRGSPESKPVAAPHASDGHQLKRASEVEERSRDPRSSTRLPCCFDVLWPLQSRRPRSHDPRQRAPGALRPRL